MGHRHRERHLNRTVGTVKVQRCVFVQGNIQPVLLGRLNGSVGELYGVGQSNLVIQAVLIGPVDGPAVLGGPLLRILIPLAGYLDRTGHQLHAVTHGVADKAGHLGGNFIHSNLQLIGVVGGVIAALGSQRFKLIAAEGKAYGVDRATGILKRLNVVCGITVIGLAVCYNNQNMLFGGIRQPRNARFYTVAQMRGPLGRNARIAGIRCIVCTIAEIHIVLRDILSKVLLHRMDCGGCLRPTAGNGHAINRLAHDRAIGDIISIPAMIMLLVIRIVVVAVPALYQIVLRTPVHRAGSIEHKGNLGILDGYLFLCLGSQGDGIGAVAVIYCSFMQRDVRLFATGRLTAQRIVQIRRLERIRVCCQCSRGNQCQYEADAQQQTK